MSQYLIPPHPVFDEVDFATWKEGFTSEECDQIIRLGESKDAQSSCVVGDQQHVDDDIRKSLNSWITCTDETEWLYQKRKVKPKKGTVCIWPGGYTHLHRGNPPMSSKYIATGWYQGNIGLTQVQTAGLNDKQYMDSMQS